MISLAQMLRIALILVSMCFTPMAQAEGKPCPDEWGCDGHYSDPQGNWLSMATMPPYGLQFNSANGYIGYAIRPDIRVESGSNGGAAAEFVFGVKAAPQTVVRINIGGSFAMLTDAPSPRALVWPDMYRTSQTSARLYSNFESWVPAATENLWTLVDRANLERTQSSSFLRALSGNQVSLYSNGDWNGVTDNVSVISSDGTYPGQGFFGEQSSHWVTGTFSVSLLASTDSLGQGLVYANLGVSTESYVETRSIVFTPVPGCCSRDSVPSFMPTYGRISATVSLDPADALQYPDARVELLSVGAPVPEPNPSWLLLAGLPICWWLRRGSKWSGRALSFKR